MPFVHITTSKWSSEFKKILSNPVLLFILGIPFFFAFNHYRGIVIDGELYLLQAIYRKFPQRFIDDVSFAYGNQDSFTLFTPLYDAFIRWGGVDSGSLL